MGSYNLDNDTNIDVTHTITGLTPNVLYNIHISAENSTLNLSEPHKIENVRPEALPAGLKILEIRTGLLANETDPSGKLLVRLDRANYKQNGADVSLNYFVKPLGGSETAATVAGFMTAPASQTPVKYLDPFYGYGGELIDNAFEISDLENDKFHMVGVYAQNQKTPEGANLNALWYGINGTGGAMNATNTPKPITKPQAPIFDNNTDISGVHPTMLEASVLSSGEVRGTIVLPNYEDSSNNVPEYTQYKMFVEDLSGQDVAGKSVTVNISNTQYLELGSKFTHGDGSSVIVSLDDDLTGLGQGDVDVYTDGLNLQNNPKHSDYVSDPSWALTEQNVVWLDTESSTQLRTDASFTQVFSGLENGKEYKIKAQLILNGLESSIVAASKTVVPSTKPQLDTTLGNKVAGIFDVGEGTILDTTTNDVAFTSSGISELLVGSNNGGYDISGLIVSFVYSFTTGTGAVVKQIHEQYVVDSSTAVVEASFNYPSEDLSGSRTYSVYVTPQNGSYNDISYSTIEELEAIPGSVKLDSLKLDSVILDISDSYHVDTSFTLVLNNGVDASGVYSKTFEVLKDKFGWDHEVKLNVISRPNDDQLGSVEYSSIGKEQKNLVAGKKPTIILEDVSNVTILPNGFPTTVTEIDLSDNNLDLAIVDPVAPSETAAMNVKYNTFYDPSNNLVSLDDTDSNYAVIDGVKNTFQINDSKNLQTSAHNELGRTTLFSEKTFTVVVESGNASLIASSNDGKFILRPT